MTEGGEHADESNSAAAGIVTFLTHDFAVFTVFILCARSIAFDPAELTVAVILSLFVSAVARQIPHSALSNRRYLACAHDGPFQPF